MCLPIKCSINQKDMLLEFVKMLQELAYNLSSKARDTEICQIAVRNMNIDLDLVLQHYRDIDDHIAFLGESIEECLKNGNTTTLPMSESQLS